MAVADAAITGPLSDAEHSRQLRRAVVASTIGTSIEWCKTHGSRGFIASWPQFGVPCGLFLANLAVLAFSQMSGDQFLTWGWRVPFFLSLILVAVGLWIRLGIMETPVFSKLVAEK